jgi:hypothetical protein
VFIDVSPEVDDAILRGLEPDREARWPDVGSFVEALAAAVPGAPATLYTAPSTLRTAPRAAGLPAALLVALCLVVAIAMFGASYAVVELMQQ